MDTNTCRYSVNIDSNEKCGLHFKNLYELIHHIEEVHIRKLV